MPKNKIAPRKRIDGIPVYCSFDEIVKIIDLKPNPDNPNIHPEDQIELLSEMIKGNGWRKRITVSNRSGMIVTGHGRYQAAIRAGLTKAPVEYQNYKSEDHEMADLIGDNKIAEFSLFDDNAVIELISNLDNNFDTRLAGIENIEKNLEDGAGQELVDKLDAESEIENQAENLVEEIKTNIMDKLDAIAERSPKELNNAQAVIVSSVKNCNDYFILADPNLKDFILELKRYSKNKIKSPLEKILKYHYSMK